MLDRKCCRVKMECAGVKMRRESKAVLVALSNGISFNKKDDIGRLRELFQAWGHPIEPEEMLYEQDFSFAGTGRERAARLMDCYRNSDVGVIFDVSGGDLANEVLPYLDYSIIGDKEPLLWGYSDLTVVLNAIYTMTGKPSVLYQVRHLALPGEEMEERQREVRGVLEQGDNALFQFDYTFLQGSFLSGTLVGGNIRCLLKLAGTPYFPDMREKVLFLESRSGDVSRMVAYLSQLQQMGVFQQVRGVLLGTFTEMENNAYSPGIEELVLSYVPEEMPVAKTMDVGHDVSARAVVIGQQITLVQRWH